MSKRHYAVDEDMAGEIPACGTPRTKYHQMEFTGLTAHVTCRKCMQTRAFKESQSTLATVENNSTVNPTGSGNTVRRMQWATALAVTGLIAIWLAWELR